MTYADSSFIVSSYVPDANTPLADQFNAQGNRLPFTFLHVPEVAKALWTGHPALAEAVWERVKEDVADGRTLYREQLDADTVAQRAAGLMRHYAPRWPRLRALDVMHVSAALECGAKTFLSFDTNSHQRVLAATQKLKVWPALTVEEKHRLK